MASASAEGGRAGGGDRVRLREGRVLVTGCKTGDWVLAVFCTTEGACLLEELAA